MAKISKLFSQNKKTLFFIIGLGLILTFFPWQYIECAPIITTPDGETHDLCQGCGPFPLQWPQCIVCFIQYIFSLPLRFAFFLLIIAIAFLGLVAGLLYSAVVGATNWLIGVILEVGITPGNPMTPQVVIDGWTFARDFANMFFILAIAFIALSTILRLREYEAKKALPTLIIIALLINFTPVIVGFIVDMGNIVTKFFLQKAGSVSSLGHVMTLVWDYLVNSILTVFFEDGRFFEKFFEIMGAFIGIVIYGLVVIVFFTLAALIYFLIALVFFFRIIILWILMILAPIAFLSKIFPATQTTKWFFPSILHWDEWWQKLIQWTIVGIPIGFFLYLSNSVMMAQGQAEIEGIFSTSTLATSLESASSTSPIPGITDQFVRLITSILAPTVALVLLAWGAMISLQAAPAGARGIIDWAKKGGKWAASRRPAKLALGAAAGLGAGIIGKTAAGARRLEAAAAKLPGGKIWTKPFTKPMSWMTRGAEMAAVPYLRKYEARARRVNWGDMFKGMEAGEAAKTIQALSTKRDRVEAAAWMAESNLIDKPGVGESFKQKMITEAKDLAKNPAYQKSASDILESLTRGVDEKVMLDLEADPDKQKELKDKITKMADEISKDATIRPQIETEAAAKDISFDQAARDIAARQNWVSGLKSGDVREIEKKSLQQDAGTRLGMKSWSSAHMSSLVNNFKKDVVEDALNKPGGLNAMFEGKTPEEANTLLEKLYQENPRIVSFFANTPAGREWAWKGLGAIHQRGGYNQFSTEMEGRERPAPPESGPPDEETRERAFQVFEMRQRGEITPPPDVPQTEEALREWDWSEAKRQLSEAAKPLAPLPRPGKGMSKDLTRLIKKGERPFKEISALGEMLKKFREIIHDLEGHQGALRKEAEETSRIIRELDENERKGIVLSPKEIEERRESGEALREAEGQIRDLESRLKENRKRAVSTSGEIFERRREFESTFREPIQDLIGEWKARQEHEKVKKEIKETYKKMREK